MKIKSESDNKITYWVLISSSQMSKNLQKKMCKDKK